MSDPDWAFRAGDAAILEALADGSHGASLRTYFGPQGHAALAALARLPPRAARRTARVIVVPGIMGSRLGTPQNGRSTRGMVWFDPAAIGAGRLLDLALPQGHALVPRGVQLFTYARLLLQMRHEGYEVALHPYDWRLRGR